MSLIARWHIVISGFTQKEDAQNGCEILWRDLVQFANPSTAVLQKEWDDNFERFSDRIARCSTDDAKVFIYAYSWGAGNGFTSLAKELAKRAILVQHAVLADPVYYSWMPGLLSKMLATFTQKSIAVPWNVVEVDYFMQKKNFPRGSELVKQRQENATIINRPTLLDLPHGDMEDAPEFWTRCMSVASKSRS